MANNKLFVMISILLIALLAACTPAGTESGAEEPVETPTIESGADTARDAAVTFLANDLGVAVDEIEVVSAEMTEFTDSCLGLGQANESCLQAITPGWLVMLSAQDQQYEVHTDETGSQVRIASPLSQIPVDPEAATAAAIAFLAGELGVTEAEIEMVSLEAAEFSDSCLGLGQENESCLQAITPGWVVGLSAEGQEYEVRTDGTGEQVRLAFPESEGVADPGVANAAAVTLLAAELGVTEAEIEVVSLEGTEFTDSCLGLGQANESCMQAITPGWLFILSVEGQEYEVRTNAAGNQARIAD